MDQRVEQLVSVFRDIEQTRMQDVPILNPALQVEAIGFRQWQDVQMGILITPWFMNLIALLPTEQRDAPPPGADEKVTYELPASRCEFLVSHEDRLGVYHSHSLFSPMAEFDSQQLAFDTAGLILEDLFKPIEAEKPASVSRRDLLRGKLR